MDQKLIKNGPQIDKKSTKIGSWGYLGGLLGPSWPQEAPRAKNTSKSWFAGPPGTPKLEAKIEPNGGVWGYVGTILAPCWDPKGHQDDINFLNDFGMDF